MEFEVLQVLYDPVLIAFIILTILAIVLRFFRMWIVSLLSCAIAGALFIVILITVGQIAGGDDLIRYLITSQYRLGGMITLNFRDILLLLLLAISFQLALAAHTIDFEKRFYERLMRMPERPDHHWEMENTFACLLKRRRQG